MPKIAALDIGNKWTGIALSDATLTLARPLKTVATIDLKKAIGELASQHAVDKIVVGLPRTMKGMESDQTRITREHAMQLEKEFPQISFILWDERLSSKRAQSLQKEQHSFPKKEDKQKEHAIAAAFILDSYLTHILIRQTDSFENS
jgi:putative holliday junction resolvase